MQKILYLFLISILLISPTTINAEVVEFTNTKISVKIGDGDNTGSSSRLIVQIDNLPSLPNEMDLRIGLTDDETGSSHSIKSNSDIDINHNIIASTRGLSISIVFNSTETQLMNHTIPNSVWGHMVHIYANWTIGTPTPDGRGFGQGTMIDLELMSDIINSSITTEQGPIVGEGILNTLKGTEIDYDGDSEIFSFSDGYGFFNHVFGMRDHIRNAIASTGATDNQINEGNKAIESIESIVTSDFTAFTSNLNGSDAPGAKLLQTAYALIEEPSNHSLNISALTDIFTNMNQKLSSAFLDFRDAVMGFEYIMNEKFDTGDFTTSETEESPFPAAHMIFFPILLSVTKRKFSS